MVGVSAVLRSEPAGSLGGWDLQLCSDAVTDGAPASLRLQVGTPLTSLYRLCSVKMEQ